MTTPTLERRIEEIATWRNSPQFKQWINNGIIGPAIDDLLAAIYAERARADMYDRQLATLYAIGREMEMAEQADPKP